MSTRSITGLMVLSTIISANAWAFAPANGTVEQALSMQPPKQVALHNNKLANNAGADQRSDGSVTFLGVASLGRNSLTSTDPTAAIVSYFRHQAGNSRIELQQTSMVEAGQEVRAGFVQTYAGIPIVGTFAMVQVKGEQVRYARHFFVDPPAIATEAQVSAEQATVVALADVNDFGRTPQLVGEPSLAIVYADSVPTLVWQVTVSSADGRWNEFVSAQAGTIVLRNKTSYDAVEGSVNAEVEPSCQGEGTVNMPVPYVQWTPGYATDVDGRFTAQTVRQARIELNGKYVLVRSYDNNNLVWKVGLDAATTNDIQLDKMPLSQIDPYMYVNQARSWVRAAAANQPSLYNSDIWRWTNTQLFVRANLPNGSFGYNCNAFYDGTLNLYSAYAPWGCNNSGRASKIVYHEYGHGIHDHLRSDPTFDHQVSEAVADFTMASITNDPNVTGLTGCKQILRGRNTLRTCINRYSYCGDSRKCHSYPGDEPHNSAPILCGALWELRDSFIAQEGQGAGVKHSDQFFVRFLSLVQDMNSSYAAAIAADEDNDNNPRNGTVHSCAINQAFLGDGQGGFAHFPGLQGQRVPCVRN